MNWIDKHSNKILKPRSKFILQNLFFVQFKTKWSKITFKSFYCQSEVCVNGKQLKPFHVGVGLGQGCILSPLLFIIYMNWIDKRSQTSECATIGNCKINCLLFADDLVLFSSAESGLQHALNNFAATCDKAGMKISTSKTEVLHLSRSQVEFILSQHSKCAKGNIERQFSHLVSCTYIASL